MSTQVPETFRLKVVHKLYHINFILGRLTKLQLNYGPGTGRSSLDRYQDFILFAQFKPVRKQQKQTRTNKSAISDRAIEILKLLTELKIEPGRGILDWAFLINHYVLGIYPIKNKRRYFIGADVVLGMSYTTHTRT